jgi:hypothetical protein
MYLMNAVLRLSSYHSWNYIPGKIKMVRAELSFGRELIAA